ncbi:hypothetical protein E3T43_15945 [Cryobacterium sp. Hh7]|uniref:glycosyl hydrolase n=1 Tax=Cryobacterium sp. Hh7 TaxID=1259159 RepID=UPI00106D414A|nr:glycosyl hydrolase [Cryobacterium sp. Hh7]TFD51775.1 hypothetical protein E3T43_15945 [Cryobacterium sp. Hh7]
MKKSDDERTKGGIRKMKNVRLPRKTVLLWTGSISVAALLLVIGVVWQQAVSDGAKSVPPITKTDIPFQSPGPAEPAFLSLQADASDQFDWWEEPHPSEEVQFLASDQAHAEAKSLAIVSTLEAGAGSSSELRQNVSVVPGETVSLALWAKAINASATAVHIPLDANVGGASLDIPGGTFDWMPLTVDYVVPPGQTRLNVSLTVDGPTEGTWIDSVFVTSPDGAEQRLQNAEFESSSADLTFENASLLFNESDANLILKTRRATEGWYHWSARLASSDEVLAEGNELISNYKSSVDLAELSPGAYEIDVRATLGQTIVERTISLAILEPLMEASPSKDSPFGVVAHVNVAGQGRLENLLGSLANAGTAHLRLDMPWNQIEGNEGVYTYSPGIESTMSKLGQLGITPLMVAAYTNPNYDNNLTPSSDSGLFAYARYANDLVTHFPDLGQELDVYNEYDHTFNSGECGKSPACYLDMLSATAETVKASNPNAVISAPGNSGMGFKFDWLEQFFALGGLQYADVISAHPYIQPEAPERLAGELDTLAQMIRSANSGVDKPIWLTEMGWASVPDWVSEEEQAEYLVRTMAIALGHGVSRVYWYSASNSTLAAGDRESNFGLFEATSSVLPNAYEPKPAAIAQAVMAREIEGRKFASADTLTDTAFSSKFSGGGSDVRVMWSSGGVQSVQVAASGPIEVTTMLGRTTMFQPVDGVVPLDLTGSPVYVSGAAITVALPN